MRRTVSSLVAAALIVTACGGAASPTSNPTSSPDLGSPAPQGSSQASGAAFDWRRFDGQEIRIVATQNPWQAAFEPLVPEFEKLTGITVKFESLPEEQFRQRLQVELTARSTDIDGFMTGVLQDGARFAKAGWYEDLKPYPENSAITSPDYGFDKFGAGLIGGHTLDGALIGIPVLTDVEMLYYRKDMLKTAGVEVPTTTQEFEDALPKIETSAGVKAWGSRGKGAAAVTQMSTFLYNFGADWTNETGHAGFNNAEGIAAFDFYGRNLRNHGPAGVSASSWEELMPLFQQRQLAMWNDSSSFLGAVTDPNKSLDVGNIGFARMPAGPAGENNANFPWALAISSLSEKKEATWYFIQWATSAAIVERLQADGVAGARTDAPFPSTVPAEWVDVFRHDLAIARPKLPLVVPVPQVRDAIGAAIVASIGGSDVAAAVAEAAAGFDRAVDAAP